MELFINEETFPQRTLSAVPATKIDRNRFAQYAHQAELMYIDENGMRVFNLPEITVTAQQKPPIRSVFYSYPDYAVTQEDIERMPVSNILDYFVGIPGVLVDKANNQVLIRGIGSNGYTLPLLVVDDVICQNFDEITSFTSSNIAQIDVLKGGAHAAIFGMRGGNGVIIIHTRRGETYKDNSIPFHVKSIIPLGYQQPVEFYVPKYDTPERQNAQTPDLRTAIHWQPVVQTDDTGEASFEFYTADAQTSYTVIIEGLADDGSIIRQEKKLYE